MRRWLPIAALLLLALPSAASAWTWGDTLTTIWRPLPNLPAILRPGDTLSVWANAPASAVDWNAHLRYGAHVQWLTAAGGGHVPTRGRWELRFRVPEGVPEEIYDLVVSSSSGPDDTSPHSVKVIPQFRTSYYFAQISDTHLPAHPFSSDGGFNTADTTGMGDFQAVIADLNVIHPEFILHTGDLVNEGELEEYLGMYEMGRAQQMFSRLRDPIFVVSGNHDIGGWQVTPMPDGTARKNWWRQFGWPFLENPPAGDPNHSQNYSFDYGPLHLIGLEGYINNGSYDHYRTEIYGGQSMSAEQMAWLAGDVAAVPPGRTKLVFYHYDFSNQFTNPAALGLDGVLYGHFHSILEASAAQRAAHPFNLGVQSVIDGKRTFRMFRVDIGVVSPGIMHKAGTSTDSLTVTYSGPNDGTRARLTATVLNRYGETWEHARVLFNVVDDDSVYGATGGTIASSLRQGGHVNVIVDCVLPAGATTVVSVAPTGPVTTGVSLAPPPVAALQWPWPNPWRPEAGPLRVRFALPEAGAARVEVFDLFGRRVATLLDRRVEAGSHLVEWNRLPGEDQAPVGLYVLRLTVHGRAWTRKLLALR